MDNVLLDIKNFLKKLETGQMEIEAGQWELHKDLVNVKEKVEEMRKLKKDVEEMKMNNVEAMELIKGLENRIEAYSAADPTISENSENYEEIYHVPKEKQNNPKGFKRRKCHRIVSEKIIEITSDVNSTPEKKQLSESQSFQDVTKTDECSSENRKGKSHRKSKAQALSDHSLLKKKRRTRKPDGVIMERYLKDAAKYRYRGLSNSSGHKKASVSESICSSTTKTKAGSFCDEEKESELQQKKNLAMKGLENVTEEESILPKRFFCSKCPKNFIYKSEFLKHQKLAHDKPKFYCRMCNKLYDRKCKLKNHVSLYIMTVKNRNSKESAYKCSYCKKASFSPKQLTAHLKRCRIISKGKFKKKL